MTLLREVTLSVVRRPVLILLFLAVNAALVGLFWLWLSMPDRTVADLAVSTAVAAVVVGGGLWMYGATLAAFNDVGRGYVVALRRLPRFLPWGVALAAAAVFSKWFLGALVVLVLLPMASQAAGGGFSFSAALRMLKSPRYWLFALPLGLVAVALPALLIWWFPQSEGLTAQTISMVVRFSVAALIAAVAWLLLASLVGHLGRQAST